MSVHHAFHWMRIIKSKTASHRQWHRRFVNTAAQLVAAPYMQLESDFVIHKSDVWTERERERKRVSESEKRRWLVTVQDLLAPHPVVNA